MLIVIVALVAAAAIAWMLLRGRGEEGPETVTASGLKYVDLVVGDGPSPQIGQTLSVHYTGTLLNGQKFDSSLDKGKPMEFQYGRSPMIKGWDEGLKTMKVGGKRKLTVPPSLGYGPTGNPDADIPPNATLLFEIELLAIK
jgi:peptidylprolyl isomerase